MGIFSDETIVSVAVSNTSLVDTEDFPNTVADAVRAAIFREEDISVHVQAAILTNFSADVKKYLNYGKLYYYRGLPTAEGRFYYIEPADIVAAIESEEGQPVTVLSTQIANRPVTSEAYEYLQDTYGWTDLVNEVTFGSKVYNVFSIRYTGYQPCDAPTIENLLDVAFCIPIPARFTITYREVGNPTNERVEYYNYGEGGGNRYNVRYHYTANSKTDVRYWTYKVKDNTYPELDADGKVNPIEGTYYPIAAIRENFKNVNSDTSSEAYITTNRLLKKLQLDINQLTDAVMESPQRKEIHSAFINISLNLETEVEESNQYLFSFFRNLNFISSVTAAIFKAATRNDEYFATGNLYRIEEAKYNTKIEYDYITLNNVIGDLGPIGTIVKSKEIIPEVLPELPPFPLPEDFDPGPYIPQKINFTFEMQISDTRKEIITIYNLRITTQIKGDRTTTGEELYVPVQVEFLTPFSALAEERILLDAMTLTIYAYDEQNLSWYESGFFQFVVFAIAVAFTVYSLGQDGGTAIGAALTAASSTGSYSLLVTLLVDVLVSISLNYAILWLSEEIGGFLGVALIFAAYIYLPTQYGGGGGSVKGMPFAESLVKATSSVLTIETKNIQEDLLSLQEEAVDFESKVESREEEIEKAQELLGNNDAISDPLYEFNVGIYFPPEETPQNFYDRTLNFDPGSLTLEAVNAYVESALTLPEADYGIANLVGTAPTEDNLNNSGWFTA